MAKNYYEVRPEYHSKSFTSPQELQHSLNYELSVHPHTAPHMRHTNPSSTDGNPSVRTGESYPYYEREGRYGGHEQPNSFPSTLGDMHIGPYPSMGSSMQSHDSLIHGQPHSFPIDRRSRANSSRESRQPSGSYLSHSLATSAGRSEATHGPPVHQQSPLASVSSTLTGHESPHPSHGDHSCLPSSVSSAAHGVKSRDDLHRVQQPCHTRPSYSAKDSLPSGSRATEEGRTAGSMSRSQHTHHPGASSACRDHSHDSKHKTLHSSELQGDHHVIPKSPSHQHCSQASLENARYSLSGIPTSDHSNEDRYFALEGTGFKAFCVCDGHNGARASGFASNYLMKMFYQEFWRNVVSNPNRDRIVCEALQAFFTDTEKEFFKSIERFIEEKESLQAKIPQV